MSSAPGSDPPAHNPNSRLTGPAINPFHCTICSGSASETLRVRLLSMPQATQAPMMASGPATLSIVGVPDHDTVAAPATRQAMRSEEHTSELQSLRHLVCRL